MLMVLIKATHSGALSILRMNSVTPAAPRRASATTSSMGRQSPERTKVCSEKTKTRTTKNRGKANAPKKTESLGNRDCISPAAFTHAMMVMLRPMLVLVVSIKKTEETESRI